MATDPSKTADFALALNIDIDNDIDIDVVVVHGAAGGVFPIDDTRDGPENLDAADRGRASSFNCAR